MYLEIAIYALILAALFALKTLCCILKEAVSVVLHAIS